MVVLTTIVTVRGEEDMNSSHLKKANLATQFESTLDDLHYADTSSSDNSSDSETGSCVSNPNTQTLHEPHLRLDMKDGP